MIEFNLPASVHAGRTSDGREWRATWRTYGGFNSGGAPPEWIVRVDGTMIGALDHHVPLSVSRKDLTTAIAQLLAEHGIQIA